MTTIKSYPAYKGSGIDWLGDIPAHWDVRRGGALFRERNETGHPDLPILEVSLNTGVNVRDFGESSRKQMMSDRGGYKRALAGDLPYNMMRMWQGAVGVAPADGLVSPAYVVLAPRDSSNSSFYASLFRTGSFKTEVARHSRGIVSDRDRLYWDSFKQLQMPLPPLDEQRAIADFLDGMNARITRFIAARRKMIALLEEKKQAVINQAVTRGLDPNVPMKDSGVDWLGEIPAHWEKGTLRQLCDIAGGMTPTKSRPDYWQGIVPWVSPKDMKRFRIGDAIDHISESAVDNTGLTMLPVGSVLLVVRGMILARKVPIAITARQLTINQDMKALLPNARVQPEYLAWVLTSGQDALFPLIDEAGHGTRRLPTPSLLGMIIPAPPIEEQLEIIDHIDRETSRIDTLISRHRREIELMQEYRTRLISDVVTGKLDVRGVELRVVEDVVGEVIEAAVEEEQTDLEPVMSGEDD